MKDESGGKVMKDFVGLRPKTYSYLIIGTKVCVINRKLKFKDHKNF